MNRHNNRSVGSINQLRYNNQTVLLAGRFQNRHRVSQLLRQLRQCRKTQIVLAAHVSFGIGNFPHNALAHRQRSVLRSVFLQNTGCFLIYNQYLINRHFAFNAFLYRVNKLHCLTFGVRFIIGKRSQFPNSALTHRRHNILLAHTGFLGKFFNQHPLLRRLVTADTAKKR